VRTSPFPPRPGPVQLVLLALPGVLFQVLAQVVITVPASDVIGIVAHQHGLAVALGGRLAGM